MIETKQPAAATAAAVEKNILILGYLTRQKFSDGGGDDGGSFFVLFVA